MTEIVKAKAGHIGLVRLEEDGSIVQIGLSETNKILLEAFLTSISKDRPLPLLPEHCNMMNVPDWEEYQKDIEQMIVDYCEYMEGRDGGFNCVHEKDFASLSEAIASIIKP